MRKITFNTRFFIILSIIIMSFSSCQKEIISIEEDLDSSTNEYTLSGELLNSVSEYNGILMFKDENVSRRVFNELNALYDAYYNSIVSNYENMEDFELALSNGEINMNYVFEKFEENFSYISMRNKIGKEEKLWLMNKNLDFKNQPNFIISDNILRAMLNSNGEYIIGGIIYKIAENGVIYGVKDIDYNSLLSLREMLMGNLKSVSTKSGRIFIAQLNGNVETLPVSNHDQTRKSTIDLDLRGNESREIVESYNDGDNYLKGRVTITNVVGISNFVKSETETYEYKGWLTGWSRINMHQWARVVANYYLHIDGEWTHTSQMQTDLSYWDDDKQAEAQYSTYPDRIRVASEGLQGWFKSDDVATITKQVTW
ncbi:MAG: hypothetical protein P1P82_15740 [Bacteroidales bacterium]|nr:hypothetical protein [Bacteroidales bacterium]MDT8432568.1 hypothetical protein [Bacteroidales bacterium]